MTKIERWVLIAIVALLVLLAVLVVGCSPEPGATKYVVVKKLADHEHVRIMSARLRTMDLYVGSSWDKTRVGYTFSGPDIIGKHPVWIDGRAVWVRD